MKKLCSPVRPAPRRAGARRLRRWRRSTSEDTCGAAGAVEEAEDNGRRSRRSKAEEEGPKKPKKEAEGGTAGSGAKRSTSKPTPAAASPSPATTATAKAGKDTINFTNSSPVPHDVAIEDSSGEEIGDTEVITEGSDSADGRPQTRHLHLLLLVPGHREAGMEGTLTVK